MSVVVEGIDFLLQIVGVSGDSQDKASKSQQSKGMVGCYLLCGLLWCYVSGQQSHRSFSSVLTFGAMVQLAGFLFLAVKVRAQRTVAGISSKTLQMYLVFLLCRLGNTLFKKGYIPSDKSGRGAYQALDFLSVLVVLHLLFCTHYSHKSTYQRESDTMKILPLLLPCGVLPLLVRLPLSRSAFFDGLWMASAYVDTLAMLPQLWMITKIGGKVEGMTSHFVAAMTARSALGMTFWWGAYKDALRFDSSHLALQVLLCTFVVQLLCAADFIYYYAKARLGGKRSFLPPIIGSGLEI